MRNCKACDNEFNPAKKRYGYATLCAECDDGDDVQKYMSVMNVDGKSDYDIEIVRNLTKEQAEELKALNVAQAQLRLTKTADEEIVEDVVVED